MSLKVEITNSFTAFQFLRTLRCYSITCLLEMIINLILKVVHEMSFEADV